MMRILLKAQDLFDCTRTVDFLAPLALRLYLFPVFLAAGLHKLHSREGTISWFRDSLHMPAPELMYWLATLTEFCGAWLLLVGLFTRWISVPLMFTMLVAACTVHWEHGWYTVGQTKPNPVLMYSEQDAEAVKQRVDRARGVLQRHGRYSWLTERGNFVILNNGIESAVTYLFMLLVLFFLGAGRYCSIDYWVRRWADKQRAPPS